MPQKRKLKYVYARESAAFFSSKQELVKTVSWDFIEIVQMRKALLINTRYG